MKRDVAPARERGLKWETQAVWPRAPPVAPARERGLKLKNEVIF